MVAPAFAAESLWVSILSRPSGQHLLMASEEALRRDSALTHSLNQFVRVHDRIRVFVVTNTADEVEPRFLAHSVNIELSAFEGLGQRSGARIVRRVGAPRLIDCAFEPTGQQRTIDPA